MLILLGILYHRRKNWSWERRCCTDKDRNRLGWERLLKGFPPRCKTSTGMSQYKAIAGPCLRARSFSGQQAEAAVGVAVLNRMLAGASNRSGRLSWKVVPLPGTLSTSSLP